MTDHSTPSWEEWYERIQNSLSHDIGELEALSRTEDNVHPSWVKGVIEDLHSSLMAMNTMWKWLQQHDSKIASLETTLDSFDEQQAAYEKRIGLRVGFLEKRQEDDAHEATRILKLLLRWKRDIQPVIDEARKDYQGKLGRIGDVETEHRQNP